MLPSRVKPECRTCKYYAKGKCRLFLEHYVKNSIMFAPVEIARTDETMCGNSGMFWTSLNFDSDRILYSDTPWKPK